MSGVIIATTMGKVTLAVPTAAAITPATEIGCLLYTSRSKQASEKLVKLGYTNIVEFGGINDWTGETVSGEA